MTRSTLLVMLIAAAWSAYGATLTVPGDYPDPGAAIENAGDQDLIEIAPGKYSWEFQVPHAVYVATSLSAFREAGQGDTPYAAEAMRIVLEGGVNAHNAAGETPLYWASKGGDLAMAKLLLDQGAAPDVSASEKASPLCLAVVDGRTALVSALLEHGADPTFADGQGDTPMCLAAQNGRLAELQLMLDKGADPNATRPDGKFPLRQAALYGQRECAQLLLEAGADINKKREGTGNSPLFEAAKAGHLRVVELLLAQPGCDIGIQTDDTGATPLHIAAVKKQHDVVRYLVKQGADVNAKMKDGKTPLKWAAEHGNTETVELLRSLGGDGIARVEKGRRALSDWLDKTRPRDRLLCYVDTRSRVKGVPLPESRLFPCRQFVSAGCHLWRSNRKAGRLSSRSGQ